MRTNTANIGRKGEKIAARFLKKNGFRIIAKNNRQSHNEIDIIAADRKYIVFVEVKTRSSDKDLYLKYGTPASAVDYAKQKRTVLAARRYLSKNDAKGKQPRMDVIEVYLEKDSGKLLKINHIQDAFGAR